VRVGYPLRYFGDDDPVEIDGVVIPPRCSVEVTFRTHQERHLLRPDKDACELILGCFGRAYHRYPELNLHALAMLSNHGCFIASPASASVLAAFMRDFMSTLARRINWHRDRAGRLWQRRYRAIPIVDEGKLEERFAYVLTQGTKEDLVASAREWPGVSSVGALLGGKPLVGRWRDYTAEAELRRQRERRVARAARRGEWRQEPKIAQVWREYPIEHVPLRHWQDLRVGERRARVAAIIHEDERRTRERHAAAGTRPLGVRGVLATDPFSRPEDPKRSPAPLCHTSGGRRIRRAFRKAYGRFVNAVRACANRHEEAVRGVGFPPGATAPAVMDLRNLLPRRPEPEPIVVYADASATGPPEPR